MGKNSTYKILFKLLSENIKILPDKPDETIESTIRDLWLFVYSKNPDNGTFTNGNLPLLCNRKTNELFELVQKRIDGVPLAYLLGKTKFLNIDIDISPGAMIPRKETEMLVLHSLDLLRQISDTRKPVNVVDTCTGSGNIALAIALYHENAKVWANDISIEAINIAQQNAVRLNVVDRITFSTGDLLAPYLSNGLTGNTDLITCNPPYISSRTLERMPREIIDYEPDLAFDGGPLGITILNRIHTQGYLLLRNGGWLCTEVGAGQGNIVAERLRRSGKWDEVREIHDANGIVRVILAKKK